MNITRLHQQITHKLNIKTDHSVTIHRIPTNTTPIIQMDLNHVRQLMRSLYWNICGREYQLATDRTHSPWEKYSQTIMESKWRRRGRWRWLRGSIPIPTRCQNKIFWPPKLGFNGGGVWSRIRGNYATFWSFSAGLINSTKGSVGTFPREARHPAARLTPWPRPSLAW